MPVAVLALSTAAAFLGSSVVLVDRYAQAPGSANPVNNRLEFDAVPRYEPDGQIMFVTLSGPHLTGLQAAIGWLDPDVDELTYVERFGTITPDEDRALNLEAMRDAKDDAPYVAMTLLGYPTELIPGDVVVQNIECVEASEDMMRCLQYVPADTFLDPGDTILSVGGTPIEAIEDLGAALSGYAPGDTVEFTVRRVATASDQPGIEQTGEVALIANPDDPTRAFIGIRLADTTQVELPFDIEIATGAIGGPSAGLAFALTVLDELTPGELTGGKRVAVTGTIDLAGNVGPIGGLRQKAVAVDQAGADVFIVPASQSEDDLAAARRTLGEDRVVVVNTIDEALEVLADLGGNARDLGTPGADYAG